MIATDVLIVGGGPSGSSCAWRLMQKGVDCLILDGQEFPRFKPCAGWITPELIQDLQMDPAEYPHSFTTFKSFQVAIRNFHFSLPTRQHAIRRVEFDDWLLKRSGAQVITQRVREIEKVADGYVIDGSYHAKTLVGAGGTHCPVARTFFQPGEPRPAGSLIVAQEEEFAYPVKDPRCYLWFFENNLPGYSWYVPKANGYVNVGLGAKAEALKAKGDTLKRQWDLFVQKLDGLGLVQGHTFKQSGHSYYLRGQAGLVKKGNAYLVGDAAGLATLDLGEGIRPAIQSGLRAAESILTGGEYSVASIPRFSWTSILKPRFG